MVSYLKTGLVTYGSADYEAFAKAYLALNVKTPFRLLYDDLPDEEKKVFQGFMTIAGPTYGSWPSRRPRRRIKIICFSLRTWWNSSEKMV